ncbi:porphobilinogen synthase [Alkalibacter rhizosphaerae]|uniref:Delta-aminolevulinic acid dehydratase n=1 Tax=Alkalibacter rhizosphaerae TaxID=2815577 RepID=A0A974XGV4_9FIRM|nr:porphobilinogen synthase [Alkalibacter rhizosphaerae]QSX09629.1 porphobilinogen synthase [Alkalibacter rhizosphaerae]
MNTNLRPRRLRGNPILRQMIRETRLELEDFIYPLFVEEMETGRKSIDSMPGMYRHSIPSLVEECGELIEAGINKLILFGIPKIKDPVGSQGYDDRGIVQEAIRALRKVYGGKLYLITDVCLCEYTSHGHCGLLNEVGSVENDPTVALLAKTALSHVKAGADMVAPSDMMDGRVDGIRRSLDESGYSHIPIMSYSVKYASSFYGPFRQAAGSAPSFGDRKTYQMDPANSREALKELELDLDEGADLVIVKPALSYLDIVSKVKEACKVPVVAYNVSGEFSMLKLAIAQGLMNPEVIEESLLSMKRAGADLIITYFAKELAQTWKGERRHESK